jgi:hypothetical protein
VNQDEIEKYSLCHSAKESTAIIAVAVIFAANFVNVDVILASAC